MDGQSTDATVEVVRAGSKNRLVLISEADRGVYDGMNKGIARASGDVIGTLNADDFYASSTVLETVAAAFADPSVDSVYGDLMYVNADPCSSDGAGTVLQESREGFVLPGERLVRRWKAGAMATTSFRWGWMPPHPTFFVRRSVYEKFGAFRLDLGTAADYELMLRFLVKHRITTRYLPRPLVKMRVGGVSNASVRNRLAANRNDRRAWEVNGLRPYPWTLWLKPLRKLPQFLARS